MDPMVRNVIDESCYDVSMYDSNMYFHFYENHSDYEPLNNLFSTLHHMIVDCFRSMNSRLPTFDYEAHYWANDSRKLLLAIETSFDVIAFLNKNGINIVIDEYYKNVMNHCLSFLCKSGGSEIPKNTDKIVIYTNNPIFLKKDSIKIKTQLEKEVDLIMIGDGSYANVYKYKDPMYNEFFVVKRAKKDLTEKEKQRFKIEYETLASFSHPNIVKVYSFNEQKYEYIMEYLDIALDKYFEKFNSRLNLTNRKYLINQFLKGVDYIHSKGKLHRDLSPRNVLLKKYDGYIELKITDFGLVKIEESDLTSLESDVKGSFNDPSLKIDGFANYNFQHEIYAITLMCVFMLTGKTCAFNSIEDPNILAILKKGTNENKNARYKSIAELLIDINALN